MAYVAYGIHEKTRKTCKVYMAYTGTVYRASGTSYTCNTSNTYRTVLYLAEKEGKGGGRGEEAAKESKRRLNWVVVWSERVKVGGQRLGSGNLPAVDREGGEK